MDQAWLGGVDLHAFGREQAELSVGTCRQRVNIEMRPRIVGGSHHRRWGRDNLQVAARADPVNMAVAVHDDRT